MKHLHIINKPQLLESCLTAMHEDDALLLIEDAVALLQQNNSLSSYTAYALQEDLISRNIEQQHTIELIDYSQFVALTIEYDSSISWL